MSEPSQKLDATAMMSDHGDSLLQAMSAMHCGYANSLCKQLASLLSHAALMSGVVRAAAAFLGRALCFSCNSWYHEGFVN